MVLFTGLPVELLSYIVERLACDYLHEYFTARDEPWNALSTLANTSVTLRGLTLSLLASSLSMPRLDNGQLSLDPFAAVRLARQNADQRFRDACRKEEDTQDDGSLPEEEIPCVHAWWEVSPLLELYSVVREMRLKRERITEQGYDLRRLANLPEQLVDPMQKVKDFKDTRLTWPALMEGAYLIASTFFVGQLSMSARFFHLVHANLREDPACLTERFDSINEILQTTEALERRCMIYLYWLHSKQHSGFVRAEHIHSSQIVPALRKFLSTPTIDSDSICADWRKRVGVLLDRWTPLDNKIRGRIREESAEPAPAALADLPDNPSES